MLTNDQNKTLHFVVENLLSHDVEFQITGGLAALLYGAKRDLYDIDIDVYKRDRDLIRRIFKEFIVEDWNNEIEGPDDRFDIWMMTLDIGGIPVDISQIEETRYRSNGGEWMPQTNKLNYQTLEFQGMSLPVVDRDELIKYKKLIARDTDLVDVEQIS